MRTAVGDVDTSVYQAAVPMSRTAQSAATMARLLIALAICFLLGEAALLAMGAFPLLDPDEPLFAEVAAEMLRTGDWLTPRYRQEPFFDRPALYYWMLAASVRLLGESDATFRLPSLLLGAGAALFAGLIARDRLGPLAGAATLLTTVTMVAFPVLSLAVTHDVALVFFTTAGSWAALRSQAAASPKRAAAYAVVAGGLLGLAVLAKGLLGLVLPSFGIAAFAIASRRVQWRWLLLQSVIALVVGSSWHLAMEVSHPGYLRYFIVDRHVKGFLTNSQRHGDQSVLVYVPTLLLGGLPWSLLFVAPSQASIRRLREGNWKLLLPQDRSVAAMVAWLAMTVGFFLVAGSRNPSYMLPALPLTGILAGHYLARWLNSRQTVQAVEDFEKISRLIAAMPVATIVVLAISIPVALQVSDCLVPLALWCASAAIVVTAITYWLKASRKRARTLVRSSASQALILQTALALAAVALVVRWVLPAMSQQRSAMAVVTELLRRADSSEQVLWFNHIPPSALHYGRELTLRRVYFRDIQEPATEPTLFVTRQSRIEEVLTAPLLQGARHIDLGGKYHLFVCERRAD